MNINTKIVKALLRLLSGGLTDGGGGMAGPGDFCIQQAVSKAIGMPELEDRPAACVRSSVVEFGIRLNDADGWFSEADRARGLRRFGVAELGSNAMPMTFGKDFVAYFNKLHPEEPYKAFYQVIDYWATTQENLIEVAEIAVQVLKRAGTKGSKFLSLAGPPLVKLAQPIAVRKQRARKSVDPRSEQSYASKLAEQTITKNAATVAA